MKSFIITWNPTQWAHEELLRLIKRHATGAPTPFNWRFRSFRSGAVGDQVFLLKQGKSPRGIFGMGTIKKPTYLRTSDDGSEYPVAPIIFDLLVDPMTAMLVGEQQTKEILPLSAVNTQSSGIGISEVVADALKFAIEINQADRAAQSAAPTYERFAAALNTMLSEGRLSQDDQDMLICHYNAPEHTLTGRQMFALMGWGGQSANRFYGALGRRLGEELNWVPAEREGTDGYYVSALILGDRSNGEFEWAMRPQLAAALEHLNWPELDRSAATIGTADLFSIAERANYAWQLRLERDSRAAKLAKAHHGVECQACEMKFSTVYGVIGATFIEAHHLAPLSSIERGDARIYTPDDFAVLCSNCHRMIHRWPDPLHPEPWDLDGFREMLRRRRLASPPMSS